VYRFDSSVDPIALHLLTCAGTSQGTIPAPARFLTLIGQTTGKQQIVARLSENLQDDFKSKTDAIGWSPLTTSKMQ
jgi:hypothetical protein